MSGTPTARRARLRLHGRLRLPLGAQVQQRVQRQRVRGWQPRAGALGADQAEVPHARRLGRRGRRRHVCQVHLRAGASLRGGAACPAASEMMCSGRGLGFVALIFKLRAQCLAGQHVLGTSCDLRTGAPQYRARVPARELLPCIRCDHAGAHRCAERGILAAGHIVFGAACAPRLDHRRQYRASLCLQARPSLGGALRARRAAERGCAP